MIHVGMARHRERERKALLCKLLQVRKAPEAGTGQPALSQVPTPKTTSDPDVFVPKQPPPPSPSASWMLGTHGLDKEVDRKVL